MMMNPVVAEISRSALKHNFDRVKQLAPNAKVLAMLKANAYGHDAFEVANTLSMADAFGVARISEALQLFKAGINKPMVLMEGCFNQQELTAAINHGFEVVIQNQQQLQQLVAAQAKPNSVKVWLKLETGMHRVGVNVEQAATIITSLKNCSHVHNDITVVTHFACADEPDLINNRQQLDKFNQATQGMNILRSCANSAAIIAQPNSHFDWVRPGLMLFGSSPLSGSVAKEHDLKPAMRLCSQVIAVNHINAGGYVGYGAKWQAQQATNIAVVAMGYGDGYPRHAKNGTPVLINGQRLPMVGRVSMDMLTVDIGDAEVSIGDPVILWGPELPAEEVARHAETISYELFCNVASRVQKVFVD
jgi:alanine racemase